MSARWSEPPVTPLGPFLRTAGEMGRLSKGWLYRLRANTASGDRPLPVDTDRRSFEVSWPELATQPPRTSNPSGGIAKENLTSINEKA